MILQLNEPYLPNGFLGHYAARNYPFRCAVIKLLHAPQVTAMLAFLSYQTADREIAANVAGTLGHLACNASWPTSTSKYQSSGATRYCVNSALPICSCRS